MKRASSKKDRDITHAQAHAAEGARLVGEELVVAHGECRPNTWNYNTQPAALFNKLVESMRQLGFVDAIFVRENQDGKTKYEIIDGEHRWLAAAQLNMPKVKITNLGQVTDQVAKKLTVVLNMQGVSDEVRLAELLRGLSENDSVEELAQLLPYSERELLMYVNVIDFSFDNLSEDSSNSQPVPSKVDRHAIYLNKIELERLKRVDKDPKVALGKVLDAYDGNAPLKAVAARKGKKKERDIDESDSNNAAS